MKAVTRELCRQAVLEKLSAGECGQPELVGITLHRKGLKYGERLRFLEEMEVQGLIHSQRERLGPTSDLVRIYRKGAPK